MPPNAYNTGGHERKTTIIIVVVVNSIATTTSLPPIFWTKHYCFGKPWMRFFFPRHGKEGKVIYHHALYIYPLRRKYYYTSPPQSDNNYDVNKIWMPITSKLAGATALHARTARVQTLERLSFLPREILLSPRPNAIINASSRLCCSLLMDSRLLLCLTHPGPV